jgi:hypothetical protein
MEWIVSLIVLIVLASFLRYVASFVFGAIMLPWVGASVFPKWLRPFAFLAILGCIVSLGAGYVLQSLITFRDFGLWGWILGETLLLPLTYWVVPFYALWKHGTWAPIVLSFAPLGVGGILWFVFQCTEAPPAVGQDPQTLQGSGLDVSESTADGLPLLTHATQSGSEDVHAAG